MAKPTKVQLTRLVELKDKKRKLESEARSFESEIGQLESKVKDHLDSLGKDTAQINGFRCTREPGQVRPKWKDELTKVLGAEAIAEIVENTPPGTTLTVSAA
ncbi:MAG: hypothetical protein Aurels2KO_10380 [Aureliella sp.]